MTAKMSQAGYGIELIDANGAFHTEFEAGDELHLQAHDRTRPRIHAVTGSGALRRAFRVGDDGLRVRGSRLAVGSALEVYLVENRRNWQPGDPFTPVRNADGSEVRQRVTLKGDDTGFQVMLWSRDHARAGSYDLIARRVDPHEDQPVDDRIFRASDLVSERGAPGVVIREDIFRYAPDPQGGPRKGAGVGDGLIREMPTIDRRSPTGGMRTGCPRISYEME